MDDGPLRTWQEIGARIAEARGAAGLTQQSLARRIGLSRTALVRMEAGERQLDVLELSRLATETGRSVEWFVTRPSNVVASHRQGRSDSREVNRLEDALERAARDVQLLMEIGELRPLEGVNQAWGMEMGSVEEAAASAAEARRMLGDEDGPLIDLADHVERLGLLAFSLDLGSDVADGAFLRMDHVGIAVVNGQVDPGRRRFNLAHELGHHVVGDEYTAEFGLGSSVADRERWINAFAFHFLMPRPGIAAFWDARRTAGEDVRSTLVRIASAYRVSWSAACGHAVNLGLIDHPTFETLQQRRPTRVDYLELGLPAMAEELVAPLVPRRFSQAALRAYRHHRIAERRLIELLRGTIGPEDLPRTDDVGLHALRRDFDPLP